MNLTRSRLFTARAIFVIALSASLPALAPACPFCQLLDEKTLVELIDENGVAVVATLTKPSISPEDRVLLSFRNKDQAEVKPSASFTASHVLKGASAEGVQDLVFRNDGASRRAHLGSGMGVSG